MIATARQLLFSYSSAPGDATGGSGAWTWTIPPGFKTLELFGISGGAGGGGGMKRNAAGTGAAGGQPGRGGNSTRIIIDIDSLPTRTLTIQIGAGGAGGAASSTDGVQNAAASQTTAWNTNVFAGATQLMACDHAGNTMFQALPLNLLYSETFLQEISVTSSYGGQGCGIDAAGNPIATGVNGCAMPGFAAGFPITGADSADAGGAATNGSNGADGTRNPYLGGGGGGGGASNTASNGGNGGNGGLYGGGGGGGGASVNASGASGAGGNGANGCLVITLR